MKRAVSPYLQYDKDSVPFLKEESIESIVRKILKAAVPDYRYDSLQVPIIEILDNLRQHELISLVFDELGYVGDLKVRGKTLLKEKTIVIDYGLATTEEFAKLYRMTAAHELGHWVLHRHIPKNIILDIIDTENEIEGKDPCDQRLYWLEHQAKAFAAALLLPKKEFTMVAQGLMMSLTSRTGAFHLSYQTLPVFCEFKRQLSDWYRVSETAIEIRLRKLNLIEDNLKVKSVGAIMRDALNRGR